ncbi:unnamed protein product [Calypogeia fissa]
MLPPDRLLSVLKVIKKFGRDSDPSILVERFSVFEFRLLSFDSLARFRSMEAAKDAANAVRNTVYSVAQKGDAKQFGGEEKSRQKAADQELEKAENVKTATGAPNVTDESDTHPMEKAKSLVDNLGKLGPTPFEAKG